MSFQYVEEIEKTFLLKDINMVIIGKFKNGAFEYHYEKEYIVNPIVKTESEILKGLDDRTIIQLN